MARKPRKLKKGIKNAIIIYDIAARPKYLDMDKLWYIFQEHGLLLYDSQAGDNPELANRVGKRVKFIDISKQPLYGKRNK